MSRSFKKTAGYVDRNPFMKSYSNKALRRASRSSLQAIQALADPDEYDSGVSSYSSFKRCSVNPYDICDWRSLYYSEQRLLNSCVYLSAPKFDRLALYTTSDDEFRALGADLLASSNEKLIREYYKAWAK